MNDTTRTVLIAAGVALLVIVLIPLLFMTGMMGAMTSGMGGMMNGGGGWIMGGGMLLVLALGVLLVVLGIRRPRQ